VLLVPRDSTDLTNKVPFVACTQAGNAHLTPGAPTTTRELEYKLATALHAADPSSFRLALEAAGATTITDSVGLDRADFLPFAFQHRPRPRQTRTRLRPSPCLSLKLRSFFNSFSGTGSKLLQLSCFGLIVLPSRYQHSEMLPQTSAPNAAPSTARITLTDAERDLATFEKGKRSNIADFTKLSEEQHWINVASIPV
jgi:hypothetical protein